MRGLQVDELQRRRDKKDLADRFKGLSSGSPLPMEFHSSSIGEEGKGNHSSCTSV